MASAVILLRSRAQCYIARLVAIRREAQLDATIYMCATEYNLVTLL